MQSLPEYRKMLQAGFKICLQAKYGFDIMNMAKCYIIFQKFHLSIATFLILNKERVDYSLFIILQRTKSDRVLPADFAFLIAVLYSSGVSLQVICFDFELSFLGLPRISYNPFAL